MMIKDVTDGMVEDVTFEDGDGAIEDDTDGVV